MRKSYVQVDGILYEKGYEPIVEKSALVMKDISPYRSQIDGTLITSRSRHREHLRSHGCIEIGNETKYLKPKPLQSPPGLKETIIRATEQVLSKSRSR